MEPLYFRLDSAEQIRAASSKSHQHDLDDYLIFGADGGGEFIALDFRNSPPYPVVFIDMVAGVDSVSQIATDFPAFIGMIGIEGAD